MSIDSKLAITIAPVLILLVHLARATVNIPDRFLPAICMLISTILVIAYVISTTGFVTSSLFDYLVAAVVAASVASGIYSWGQTINTPTPPATSPPTVQLITKE